MDKQKELNRITLQFEIVAAFLEVAELCDEVDHGDLTAIAQAHAMKIVAAVESLIKDGMI